MLKRTIPLLIVIAIVFTAAPDAMANHCVRCRFTIDTQYCFWGAAIGRTDCDDWSGVCQTFGDPCNHQLAASLTPLSADFQVASVERFDEPASSTSETLVATLDTPPPAAENR